MLVNKYSWIVAVLTCRRFGFVAVLVVSKTATRQNGDKSKIRRHVIFFAVLDTSQHGVLDKLDCRRFGFVAVLVVSKTATRQNGDRHAPFWLSPSWLSPFWMCRRFGMSPFWMCRRFGCRRFGVSPFWFVAVLACRRFGLSPFWFVAVLDLSPFWLSPFWLSPFWICRRFDLYPDQLLWLPEPRKTCRTGSNC